MGEENAHVSCPDMVGYMSRTWQGCYLTNKNKEIEILK